MIKANWVVRWLNSATVYGVGICFIHFSDALTPARFAVGKMGVRRGKTLAVAAGEG